MFSRIAATADFPLSEIHNALFAAKGIDTFHAAGAAAWFHGRAGDLANDVSSLVSSEDVLRAIPDAMAEIFFAEEE